MDVLQFLYEQIHRSLTFKSPLILQTIFANCLICFILILLAVANSYFFIRTCSLMALLLGLTQCLPLYIIIPGIFFVNILAHEDAKENRATENMLLTSFYIDPLPSLLIIDNKFRANINGERLLKKHKLTIQELLDKLQNASGKLIDQLTKGITLNNTSFILRVNDSPKRYGLYLSNTRIGTIIKLCGYKKKYAKQEYQRMQKQQNRFLCSLSHEFMTPLNHIIASLEIHEPQSPGKETLNIAMSSAQQMLFKVQDLLDYASIEYGQFKEHKTLFRMKELFDELNLIFIEEAKNKGISLVFESPNTNIDIFSDFKRLKQIFSALIQNSIKFTSKGFAKVSAAVEDNSITFRVEDSGCGMDEQEIKPLFKKNFMHISYDFEKTSNIGELFGMGLCVAQMIALKMGTVLNVTSHKNVGTTFFFTLPNCVIEKPKIQLLKYTRVTSEKNIEFKSNKSIIPMKSKFSNTRLLKTKSAECKKLLIKNCTAASEDDVPDEFINRIHQSRENYINVPYFVIDNQKLIKFRTYTETSGDNIQPMFPQIINLPKPLPIKNKSYTDEKERRESVSEFTYDILVVDDDSFNRTVVQKLFHSRGVKVDTAKSGYEAIQIVKQACSVERCFKLILMDINMPELNGIKCSEELINFWESNKLPSSPIIALTACSSEIEKEECSMVGMCDFINKPINHSTVCSLIRRYL